MGIFIAEGREVNVGDTVKLIGKLWYTDDHEFKFGDVMTIVDDNEDTQYFMKIDYDGIITVERAGVLYNPNDFM
jgi:hypothetical protein